MGKKHQEGFTLIELLVLMMVAAIALGIGVPAFSAMVANTRMSSAANELLSSFYAARSESSSRARTVVICASSDWSAATAGCDMANEILDGWIVFVDRNANGTRDAGDELLQAYGPVHDAIRRNAASGSDAEESTYLAFRPDGLAAEIAGLGPGLRNIQLCDQRGDEAIGDGVAAGRWIGIAPTGRPVLYDRSERLRSDANPLGGC